MTTKEKIIKTIDKIPEPELPELLELVEDFRKRAKSKRGGKWARFAGILTDEEARIMKEAIEEEFEKIEDED
ncbi:MAG: hypothetical protein AB1546_01275 [bacterium]